MMATRLTLALGVKSDPIEYRYSFPWLFELMAEEEVRHLQLGTFFELYQLPDEFFVQLRDEADQFGISITSCFTAHRELGGFFRHEPGFIDVARGNYERYIEVAAILGATSVGSNPGAVLRDRMHDKAGGIATYIEHMKALMHHAYACGVARLTIEPMSCLAEPPTLPDEVASMAGELADYHAAHPATADIGYCVDIAHGYVNASGEVIHGHLALLEAALDHLTEIHLKNTDSRYESTFGFTAEDRERGIMDVAEIRELLRAKAYQLPVSDLVGYLEIGGPKLGRDYSDASLERHLRDSLRYLKDAWGT